MADAPKSDWRRGPFWSKPSGLALGIAVAVYTVVVVWLAAGEIKFSDGHWVPLLVVSAVGTWALAWLVDLEGVYYPQAEGSARPPAKLGIVKTFVVVWVLLWATSSIWLALDPPPDLLGLTDRVMILPILVALFIWFARAMRIRTWMMVVSVLIILGAVFQEAPTGDWPAELVAAAGPADLKTSLDEGSAIGLLSARHDRGAGVAMPPRRDGMRCQRIIAHDQRRTLVGAEGRRIEVRAEACWLRDGAPFSVQVVQSGVAHESRAEPRSTQIIGVDPFDDDGSRELIQPARIPPPEGSYTTPGSRIHAFQRDGRVRLSDQDGPVTIHVTRKGREIDLITGWLAVDPAVEGELSDGRGALNAGGSRVWPGAVALGQHPQPNEVLDIFRVRFFFAGGPDARLQRVRPRGTELLTQQGYDPGYVKHGPLELETIRLTGGT